MDPILKMYKAALTDKVLKIITAQLCQLISFLWSPLLFPTSILIDGRTNNARFLNRMSKRNWDYFWDLKNDISVLNLYEDTLIKND